MAAKTTPVNSANGTQVPLETLGRIINPLGGFPFNTARNVLSAQGVADKTAKEEPSDVTRFAETIHIGELKKLIEDNLETLWTSPAEDIAMMIPPIMIWGAPGVGKSTAIREIAKDLNIGFIDVRLAQREPVDMRGLPVPDGNSVKWLVSSEWPRDPESRGIILFDELTAADKTLQVAAYEFILDRRLGGLYSVPKGWYVMAAGNRVEDRAVACSMSSALANRFLHVEVSPDAGDFIQWAERRELHPAVIEFIRRKPSLLFSQKDENLQRGWPSPRSWERVSTMLYVAEGKNHRELLAYSISGLIGKGAAAEFISFYRRVFVLNDKIDIKSRLLSGEKIPVQNTPDMLHACCTAIVYFIKSEKAIHRFQTMCENGLKFAASLPNDFAAMLITELDSSIGNDKYGTFLREHPIYQELKGKCLPAGDGEKDSAAVSPVTPIRKEDGDLLKSIVKCPYCGQEKTIENLFLGLHTRCSCGKAFPTGDHP